MKIKSCQVGPKKVSCVIEKAKATGTVTTDRDAVLMNKTKAVLGSQYIGAVKAMPTASELSRIFKKMHSELEKKIGK
jgi:hypothetical protein